MAMKHTHREESNDAEFLLGVVPLHRAAPPTPPLGSLGGGEGIGVDGYGPQVHILDEWSLCREMVR